jgi:kynurenine formamidase
MRVIDLTHPISAHLPVYYPWHPVTSIEQTANYRDHHCVVRRLSIGTHSGTHIDAPSHIFQEMPTLEQYDPNLWYTEAMVLDFTPREPRQVITPEEMRQKLQATDIGVIVKTGWDKYFGREDYYTTYPPISNEAAEFLVEGRVSVVAADTPFTFDVHKILLKKGIPLITNINHTNQLTSGRVRLIAAPLLIQGGDGAPARVMAVVE